MTIISLILMERQFSYFPAFITFLLLILSVLKIWKKPKAKKCIQKLPPGPWRLPLVGNMHQLVGSLPHHRLRDLAKKYGPLMHLQLGEVSTVVISSPEVAKEVLKTHDIAVAQRPFNLAASILAYNAKDIVFAPYGDYWRQLRKICILELLTAKRVQSFRSIREEEVSNLIKSIHSSAGSPVNLTRMLVSLSNCIISRTAFGMSHKHQDAAFVPVIFKIIQAMGGFGIADVFPSSKLIRKITGMSDKLKSMHQEADAMLENIIDEHRARKKAAQENAGSKDEASDLVDVLLNLQDQGDLEFTLSQNEIKAIILDLFLGGVENSSSLTEWAMSEMLKNPEVMEKAQTEVRQAFENKEKIEGSGLHELKYLNLIMKETLRLHAPAPLLPRESRERIEINGYEIPAKTKIILNAWAIGRDPRYWIEAERFCPERFVDSSIDYKGKNFEFIPFGAGRRICPGMLYGMASVELTLASLLYHFDWKMVGGRTSGHDRSFWYCS